MPELNSMQMNVGMGYNTGAVSSSMPTPTPAQTSSRLMQEASQRSVVSQSIIQQSGGVVPSPVSAFSQQFQEQFQAIQSRQSLSPMAANYMAGGAADAYMPSPLTMTPAETGVFRPPAPSPIASIPPMQLPTQQWSPFSPRPPAPMFRTQYEQSQQLADYSANRQFSYASQIPNIVGTGVGIGAGALAGAKIGGAFGARGRLAGAVGGAALSGLSGFAEGVGDIFQLPMKSAIQRREMGAAIQNMSQDWVVSGPQLHGLGKGLTRDASIQMAGEVQDLTSNKQFQQETGEMFNQRDMMSILRKGGQAGLFDAAQSVPQIRQQLRETAGTIKEFMQLTNDPSVSNVIKEMGRLRQFGLNQQDMLTAAQGMRTFSRAAGTTIQGLQETGGMPGAMTFQRAGLTAGQGFMYGNFSAASARQMVASGGVNERQLSLLGGVQGMTQRDIQAQASLNSMPLFAASNMQYGPQGWGVNAANVGQTNRGAFGMVQNASSAINQAVSRGGIGALAMLPLQQREMADKAASMMTPQEQMAQRFQLAMQTGERLGMSGESAMAAGSRLLYGDEVAEQMMYQAKSPDFFRNQREIVKRQRRELYAEQRQKDKDAESMLPEGLRLFGRAIGADKAADAFTGGAGSAWRSTKEGFESLGGVISSPFKVAGDYLESETLRDQGIYRRRLGGSTGRAVSGLRASIRSKRTKDLVGKDITGPTTEEDLAKYRGEVGDGLRGYDSRSLALGFDTEIGGVTESATTADWMTTPLEKYLEWNPITALPMMAFESSTGIDLSDTVSNLVRDAGVGLATMGMSPERKQELANKGAKKAREQLKVVRQARKRDKKVMKDVYKKVGKGSAGAGRINIIEMGQNLDKTFLSKSTSGDAGVILSDKDYIDAMIPVLIDQEGLDEPQARKRARELLSTPGIKATILGSAMDQTDPENKNIYRRELEEEPTGATDSGLGLSGLKKERMRLEEELDIDSIFGGALGEYTYSGAEEKIQKVASELGGGGLAAVAAVASSRKLKGKDRNKRLREIQKRYSLDDDQLERIEKEYGALDEDVQDVLAKAVDKGGPDALKKLEAYGSVMRETGQQEAFKSEGFQRLMGKYSDEVSGYLAETTEGITGETLASKFTEDDLKRMSKSRSSRDRRLASTVKAAQGEGAEAKRAQAQLEKVAVLESGIDVEGNEDVAAGSVAGKEAKKLEAAEDAMVAMEDVANTFAPAVKEFTEGARMFREAMESDIIANRGD